MNKTRSAHLHPDAFSTRSWAAMTDTPTTARGKKLYLKTTKTGEKVTTKPGLWARVTRQAVALKGGQEAKVKQQLREILLQQQSPETVKARRGNDKQPASTAGAKSAVAKTWRTKDLRQAMQMQQTGQRDKWQRAARSETGEVQSALAILRAKAEEPLSPEVVIRAIGTGEQPSDATKALDETCMILQGSSQSLKSIPGAIQSSAKDLEAKHQRAIALLKLSTLGQVSVSDLGFEDYLVNDATSAAARPAERGARNLARIIAAAGHARATVDSVCEEMKLSASHRPDDLEGFQAVCRKAVTGIEEQIESLTKIAGSLMTIGERVPDMPDRLCHELAFHGTQMLRLAAQFANAEGPIGMGYRIAKLGATDPQAAVAMLRQASKSPLQRASDDLDSLAQAFGLDPVTGADMVQELHVFSQPGPKSAADLSALNEPLASFSGFAWPKKPTTMKEAEQAYRTARLLLIRAKRSNDETAKTKAQVRFDQAAALLRSLQAAAVGTSPITSADDSAAIATTATGDPTEKSLQDRYVAVMDDIDAALKVLNEPRG